MASKDIVTGKWAYDIFKQQGLSYVRTTLDIKGYDTITQTARAESIWGNIENLRRTKQGHTKADLYEYGRKIATMTLHKSLDFLEDYGNSLGGKFKLNIKSEKLTLWDQDIAPGHWMGKVAYENLF